MTSQSSLGWDKTLQSQWSQCLVPAHDCNQSVPSHLAQKEVLVCSWSYYGLHAMFLLKNADTVSSLTSGVNPSPQLVLLSVLCTCSGFSDNQPTLYLGLKRASPEHTATCAQLCCTCFCSLVSTSARVLIAGLQDAVCNHEAHCRCRDARARHLESHFLSWSAPPYLCLSLILLAQRHLSAVASLETEWEPSCLMLSAKDSV